MIRLFVRIVLTVLLLVLLAAVFVIRSGHNSETTHYTMDEIEELFRERHDEFAAVAELFLENEKIDELMSASSDRVLFIYGDDLEHSLDEESVKGCLSEEDRESIRTLFKETGMLRLEYNARTKPEYVRFTFGDGREHINLYCLSSEDGAEAFFHNTERYSKEFYQIEEHWYIQYFTAEHFLNVIKEEASRK